jgi:hypothetical protein
MEYHPPYLPEPLVIQGGQMLAGSPSHCFSISPLLAGRTATLRTNVSRWSTPRGCTRSPGLK